MQSPAVSRSNSTRRHDGRDVVIVGGGIAGLFAALVLAAEADVLVLSKGPLVGSTASSWAQGGVAAALAADDSPDLHYADTLRVGRGLCRPSAVRALTDEAPARIADLVEFGVPFDVGLGLEGGHSRRRIVHAEGANTGHAIARTLRELAIAHPRIEVVEDEPVLGLWTLRGRVVGAIGSRGPIAARATLLATGGAAALWARTTNPPGSVGDGMTMAYRAGAALAGLELVQFHPTALLGSGLLLSEALRGEGALLLDDGGRRFTDELAPRDEVARAIDARGTALLDLRAIDRSRFPGVMGTLARAGFDPALEPIPVAPAAHYSMGGIVTDLDGRSGVDGLFAAGECTCTGVHGANRLASNSLLECLVFGRRAALAMLQEPALPRRLPAPAEPIVETSVTPALRAAMWRDAGLVRDGAGLERLLRRRPRHLLASLVAESALHRAESRGAHFRADFPAEDPAFEGHIVMRPGAEAVVERWS